MRYESMAVMGFWEVIKNLLRLKKYLKQTARDIRNFQPDAVVFVDFAGFNLRLAQKIHLLKCHKFYYIAPKIWAWNQKRALKVKKLVEKAFVILPFEEAFYNAFQVPVSYVGNPVCEAVNAFLPDKTFLKRHIIKDTDGIIALLPGSRKQELITSLPILAKVAGSFPDKTFGLSIVDSLPFELYAETLHVPNVIPIHEDTYNLLLNSEAAIVTSGTATLETALFEVPQIVTYRTSKLTYEIGKRLVRVKYISLVNLIAEEPVVKELIQDDFSVENVVDELRRILSDNKYKNSMLLGYTKVRQRLGNENASANTAQGILDLMVADTGY
ncbi:MAG: lipid-A-disaccharide synthase [Cyclobacteriaceae bacterium]|nr:lipid-A-disaccharide synthase [Cyclobacteriaceae bacterium]